MVQGMRIFHLMYTLRTIYVKDDEKLLSKKHTAFSGQVCKRSNQQLPSSDRKSAAGGLVKRVWQKQMSNKSEVSGREVTVDWGRRYRILYSGIGLLRVPQEQGQKCLDNRGKTKFTRCLRSTSQDSDFCCSICQQTEEARWRSWLCYPGLEKQMAKQCYKQPKNLKELSNEQKKVHPIMLQSYYL